MTATDLKQFVVDNPEIGQNMCLLMLERGKTGKATIIKDLIDLGIPADMIWEWTLDPDTNVIDVSRLAYALYEHCWGIPAASIGVTPAMRALVGAQNFIVEKLVLRRNHPVPCSTCGAEIAEPCTYYGVASTNKHDARMDAIHATAQG